ncbi:prepilin-type N-terminal cleavage/methylation domain-containing protein [Candidatus Saccharibacteria bacterium]|nr:prepilin-type N-terminal cleavage/methylation domain-containing protein [Candidatus Saccharibacteria bacterium]HPR09638.1 prepilin-type N-terminal cleavage/methylation domain-containing protein [Candidatus Saccharibacteria bacterium]
MVLLTKKNKGFTIVELLIVIVIIGILATLVIMTFTGIRQKDRNTQRQTDIKAVNGYVESFYAEYGYYPYAGDMQVDAFNKKYMKGLDSKALVDPKQKQDGTETYSTSAVAAGTYQYSYLPLQDDNTACTGTTPSGATDEPTDTGCTKYTLTANLEGPGNKTFVKESN